MWYNEVYNMLQNFSKNRAHIENPYEEEFFYVYKGKLIEKKLNR